MRGSARPRISRFSKIPSFRINYYDKISRTMPGRKTRASCRRMPKLRLIRCLAIALPPLRSVRGASENRSRTLPRTRCATSRWNCPSIPPSCSRGVSSASLSSHLRHPAMIRGARMCFSNMFMQRLLRVQYHQDCFSFSRHDLTKFAFYEKALSQQMVDF